MRKKEGKGKFWYSLVLLVAGLSLFFYIPVCAEGAGEGQQLSVNPQEPQVDAEGVYQIGTAEELYWYAGLINGTLEGVEQDSAACAVLTANIDLNPGKTVSVDSDGTELNQWTPIGSSSVPYEGTFDGQGHTIRGIYINQPQNDYVGLFGYADSTSERSVIIRDIQIENSYISGKNYVGGIVGMIAGHVQKCQVENSVEIKAASYYAGGVIGCKQNGDTTECTNEAPVSGTSYIGGIVGDSRENEIAKCVNSGEISGSQSYVGGILGRNEQNSTDAAVISCENKGNVSGHESTGGIVGNNFGKKIQSCKNTGSVKASGSEAGGIVGFNSSNSQITDCINEGTVTGDANKIGGIVGYDQYGGVMEQCRNTGAVTGGSEAGGLAGRSRADIQYCYNTGTVSGTDTLGGLAGASENRISDSYSTGTVTGTGKKTGGIAGESNPSVGSITNCYYLNTTDRGIGYGYAGQQTFMKSPEQFQSGNVAWSLNNLSGDAGRVWCQDLSSTGSLPGYEGGAVYCTAQCGTYSNTEYTGTVGHSFDANGFCTGCGWYEPAEKNSNGIYEIGNAGQLYWFAALVNNDISSAEIPENGDREADAVLTTDIVVNAETIQPEMNSGTIREWTPIGSRSRAYKGTFNGAGYSVSGIYINQPSTDYVGLIGDSDWAKVYHVTLKNSCITGRNYVGGIGGHLKANPVTGCRNEATVTGSGNNIGGIGGDVEGTFTGCVNTGAVSGGSSVGGIGGNAYGETTGKMEDCRNERKISGQRNVGGILGYSGGHPVYGCTNTGEITGSEQYAGGICGYGNNDEESAVYDSINTGTVTGRDYVGGISGSGAAYRCGNEGKVSGNSYVGGICATNSRGYIKYCYNIAPVSGTNRDIGGILGGMTGFSGNVMDCYNLRQVTGGENTGAITGEYVSTEYPGTNYYLEGTCEKGIGNRDAGESEMVQAKTANQFASGEVTWKLNHGITDGTQVWYQNLDNGAGSDARPLFEGGTVYPGTSCSIYTNTQPSGEITVTHDFSGDANGFCNSCGQYQEPELNGDGIYEIKNAGQLYWFAALVNGEGSHADFAEKNPNASGMLMNDIVVNEGMMNSDTDTSAVRPWTPVGSNGASYYGAFDGNDCKVSGLYCRKSSDSVGMFGIIQGDGNVKNLTVADSYFAGTQYVGAVSGRGWQLNQTVENCANENSQVAGTGNYIGGVFGYSSKGMNNCSNSGKVSGAGQTGGIAGYITGGGADGCSNSGSVTGTASNVGGIAGSIGGDIMNCRNTGVVNGNSTVGGIVGRSDGGRLINSYNTGNVTGGNQTGGIAGYCANATVENSFNTGAVTGSNSTGSICGYNGNGDMAAAGCYYLEGTAAAAIGGVRDNAAVDAKACQAEELKNGEIRSLLQGFVYADDSGPELKYWRQGTEHPEFVDGDPLVNVEITWDSMGYTYREESAGTWNTVTHQYDGKAEAGWYSDGGNITVKNTGNVDVKAGFTFSPETEFSALTGIFQNKDQEAIRSFELWTPVAGTLSSGQAKLVLEGTPEKFEENAALGTVTVTIRQAGQGEGE